jgi:hypoxanthine phosphoribosyltransferase
MEPAVPTSLRVFDHRRIWQVTSDLLQEATMRLSETVLGEHGPVDHVIGIAEGGTVPARMIASALDAHCCIVRARHNTSAATFQQATGIVHVDLEPLIHELGGQRLTGRVLLVDDICGSGATLRHVTRGLAPLMRPDADVLTATLCLNSGASTRPDYSVWTVSDWVVFPWEIPPADHGIEPLPIPTEVVSHA